jgi:hypothetical protein
MFSWLRSKSTPLRSDEYETLLKRWTDLEQRVRRLELNENDMRDKVLRKLQRRSEENESNITQEDTLRKVRKRFGGRSLRRN